MIQKKKTHVLAHTHQYGTTRYLFVPPEGFEVPYGSYFGGGEGSDGTDYPELMALVSFMNVDYEPEKGETIDVAEMDETVHEPTLRQLQKLIRQEQMLERSASTSGAEE
ncbi:hypothetical protein DET61_11648 [Marinobacter nauticus]|uniref:Uncharacterized protein n=1 Tax=Marinobacter nauticus TaxID=2743 RepID=A0A368XC34_MARNT|nr:hypothetical protein [Marinobacter nauticus]RCW64007.1 hypothetical protein DET61_11648 [Marinobacter nauticus]